MKENELTHIARNIGSLTRKSGVIVGSHLKRISENLKSGENHK